ncbi:MAG TPA: polysaccharide ABC transporter ATP-binding protein [Methanoregulaceae archaeon]|nr:polysaccharide ABC transporter ATP-binding protein [Methanoregulaceae archaeon]HQJ88755.1 polysaccharide ABC transporter ATP-binding protein [Methanoregulaceae archaeon]
MSDDIAIRVNGLGKKYRIAHETAAYKTLGETITRAVKAPFRRLAGDAPSRTIEEFWALKDVSFEVKRGEVVGIIGRNGAGKSTLLKILSRITTPTEGTVEVHGRIGSLLEVGTGFHPELSGRENIYLSGSILGMKRSEIDAKFDEIVKFAEMERFLDTPVKRYSSGMYVRLAFAVAAHLEPEILIIDEVLAVGDAAFQKKCLGKMGDVAKEGRTVLFVSHNMRAVASLCSTGILLHEGSIFARGPASAMVAKYTEMLSGDLVSSKPFFDFPPRHDHPASIIKVRITDPADMATLIHNNLNPIILNIEFVVTKLIKDLDLWLVVFSLEGSILFQTCHRDHESYLSGVPPSREIIFRPGRYRARMEIPAPLINEGSYELYLALQVGIFPLDVKRNIFLTIEDNQTFASSVLGIRREGFFCLPIPWNLERIEELYP